MLLLNRFTSLSQTTLELSYTNLGEDVGYGIGQWNFSASEDYCLEKFAITLLVVDGSIKTMARETPRVKEDQR